MRMIQTFLKTAFAIFLISSLIPLAAHAQENQNGMSEKELKEYVQGQFEQMYKRAMDSASSRLEKGEPIKAFSVVTDRQGNVRLVRLQEAEKMKPDVALEIMRRSLRAMVENGKIGATCLVYVAANPNKEAEAKQVLVAEMEHVFGPTLAEITPFAKEDGKMVFGKAVTVKSKHSIFKLPDTDKTEEPAE